MSRIVHIGYPKTATTFLQKEVFPYLDDINYIDYHTCEKVFNDLIYLDNLDFDEVAVRNRFGVQKNEDILYSFEALTGAPFIYKGLGRSQIADRLKAIGFDKIIITIRDQIAMYDSLYRQYVIQGGVVRFKDFLDKDKKWNLYRRSFNPDYLKYDRLISYYTELFGAKNVLVLTQENLKHDKQAYLSEVEAFIGKKIAKKESNRKVNSSLSNLSISVLRIVNHFIFTSQKPNNLISNYISTRNVSRLFMAILDPYFFRFFSSKKSYVRAEDKKYIQSYYSESNSKTNVLLSKLIKDD